MSFIFSRALVEACLQDNCSGTDVSALLSGSHTPPLFLPSDKTMAFSRLSRFGMTFGHLTDGLGAALLTSWLEASRARTSALPARAQASPESDLACGPTWRASLAKYDPDSCSWKTAQLCLLGDSELSLVTWPRSGMTAGGQCWELPMLERRTRGTGFGFWLGTPTATMSVRSDRFKSPGMTPAELVQQYPERGMWPTPTVCGNYNRKGASATSGDGLATVVKKFPTPTATNTKAHHMRGADHGKEREARSYGAIGQLNPTWVEWLMGWPLGWTDLRPLAMGKCHSAQPKPSDSLQPILSEAA